MSPDLQHPALADLFAEDASIAQARAVTPTAPDAAVGALLSVLAGAAKTAVEIGSCAGVSGRWLLRGMPERGVLTSVEPSRDVHDQTAAALADAASDGRARPIQGDPATVLGRLADAGYQLVLMQTDPAGFSGLVDEVLRVLAPGGVLVARGLLRDDAADPAAFVDAVRASARSVTVLPIDGGLLLATR